MYSMRYNNVNQPVNSRLKSKTLAGRLQILASANRTDALRLLLKKPDILKASQIFAGIPLM